MKKNILTCVLLSGLAGGFLLTACGGGGSDLEPFNTSCFPLAITSADRGWCNIAFDADGNLIFPNNMTDEVLFVDRLSCTLSTLTTVPAGGQLYSIVNHPGLDTIYVGDTSGNIYAGNPSSGASTLLVDIGDYVNALVVAPEGYGSFEGQLLVATPSGVLVAVNTASGATTDVADTGGTLSDLEFARDGTLYVVEHEFKEIITIAADGMTSTVASGFTSPDGIAVDEGSSRLLVSDYGDGNLYSVQMSDGAKTSLGYYNFDGGYYPSGLAFDGVETLLMATRDGDSLTIQALTF